MREREPRPKCPADVKTEIENSPKPLEWIRVWGRGKKEEWEVKKRINFTGMER